MKRCVICDGPVDADWRVVASQWCRWDAKGQHAGLLSEGQTAHATHEREPMTVVESGLEGIILLNEHHQDPLALMEIISVAVNQGNNIVEIGRTYPWQVTDLLVLIEYLFLLHQAVIGRNPDGAVAIAKLALGTIPGPAIPQ